MNRRAAFLLASLAGLSSTAPAQELFKVTYDWHEVLANTTIPVVAPNSVVEPGEGARIMLTFEALINGANVVGQTTSYSSPPPPGFGTVRGLGSFI